MSVYLHDVPLPQAKSKLDQALDQAGLNGVLGEEELALSEQLLGRVLSRPILAKISSPHYHASAMDGFAVCHDDTVGALQTQPLTLPLGKKAKYVDTGDVLPEGFNAVIPIEEVEPVNEAGEIATSPRDPFAIRIRQAVTPWQHVRPMGEDMVASQLVLPSGHILRPVDLGAIAGCGHHSVYVARKPRVAILPTGSELVDIGKMAKAGEIIEYNSLVLAAQVEDWGGLAERYSITVDELEKIKERVAEAVEDHDLVLINAGSSAGAEDYSAQVVESLGQLLVHGVAVRPGHPVIIGMVPRKDGRQVPVIGVPGYPVSAALTGEIFIEPLLARWLGRQPHRPETVVAELTRKVTSPAGDDDFMRVAVGRVGERLLAAPLTRGAGVISSLVRADGLALLPRGAQGKAAGDPVEVMLYRKPSQLEKSIFAIGSHDLTLDLMAQFLAQRDRRLVSANVGSIGGLVALRRGEAHIAGAHLLDPASGAYNLPYLPQYLPDVPVRLVSLVERQQGLMVKKGNPKGINDLDDLVNPEVVYVNRQRGAGTRVLLDYQLAQKGISGEDIRGYGQEEFTHLSVAAAVASGRADCGMGIAAAADALQLDFIPLYEESYELVIPEIYFDSQLLAPLFDVLRDEELVRAIHQLPGYGTKNMGKVSAQYSGG